MKKLNKGFTLVELIIVIAILAIIMLIAIPNFSGIQQRMQVRADKATAAQIGKAVRVWFTDYTTDATLAAATADGTVLPNDLKAPTAAKTVALNNYDSLTGIGSYITTGYRASSLKTSTGAVYTDTTDNSTGGYYGVFMTVSPTDSSAKIAIAIASSNAAGNIEGITAPASTGDPYVVKVAYDGSMSDTTGGGVAYVEP